MSERLLGRHGTARTLAAYRASGGMRGLAAARDLPTQRIPALLQEAGLVGRGGAGFPTGRKWDAVRLAADPVRYVVMNADESEPGTFKDRALIDQDPFLVLEGLLVASYTVGAERAYIYIRGEYHEQAALLQQAVSACRDAGLLDGLGRAGATLAVEIRRGGGAYICGEETALFNSMEGYRGEPRSKPPFPTEHGLFGRPTLVNNVETLANVPGIVEHGATWYRSLGTAASPGTKVFSIAGHVQRPGAYEVPFGTPLTDLLHRAGAPSDLKAVLMGGAAGTFLFESDLDLTLSYEAVRPRGATLGSGAVMVFNRSTNLWRVAERLASFFARESCGQCVPCRIGTKRQHEILHKLSSGGGGAHERELLRDLDQVMTDASICGLGQTAAMAVRSLLAAEAAGAASAS